MTTVAQPAEPDPASAAPQLLPAPRRLTRQPGHWSCQGVGTASADPAVQALARRAGAWFTPPAAGAGVTLQLETQPAPGLPAQGYRLAAGPAGARLEAHDAAGLFLGLMTCRQLARQYGTALPAVVIEDWPELAIRGVMLDVSRDKVPSLATLESLIEDFAGWKINHVQLYLEHTFAYPGHRDVWAQASPYTAADIRRLDAFCRERFVELVPQQNSFGHFKRWLDCPRYRHLAELTGEYSPKPGERRQGPWSLDLTNPEALALLDEIYRELLPNFSGREFHIGFDESWDLGFGKSRLRSETIGRGRLFLEHLNRVAALARAHGRRPWYWADMIWNQFPELIPDLPRDAVAADWGYYGSYPFRAHGERFRAAGVPFVVAAGTSTWCTLSGCSSTAWDNNRNGALAAAATGALGILNTDWGDHGHWQYLAVSLLPFAMGASQAWGLERNPLETVLPAADRHLFRDPAGVMARFAYDLGETWRHVGRDITTAHVLDQLVRGAAPAQVDRRVTADTLRATREYVDATMARLATAQSQRPDAELLTDEFRNCARFLRHGCDVGLASLTGASASPAAALALGSQLRELLGEHRRLWCARNRVGGLQDSARALEERLAALDALAFGPG